MFKTKVYLYDSSKEDNSYRGEDFSKYILQGNENTEDITEEMDISEITLAGLPFSKEFVPETKLIIDLVYIDKLGIEEIKATIHRCVSKDMVNQPILSDDNYFDHHISLIEPSVVAQKRLVDNIATTYKLKDVVLIKQPAYPDTEMSINLSPSPLKTENYGSFLQSEVAGRKIYKNTVGKTFELEGSLKIRNDKGEEFSTIYNNIDKFAVENDVSPYMATFIIPKLIILSGVFNLEDYVGDASITCLIQEYDLNNNNITGSWSKNFISNSIIADDFFKGFNYSISNSWIIESVTPYGDAETSIASYRKYTDPTAETPTYEMRIPVRVDKKYVIQISLYQFDDNLDSGVDYVVKHTGQPSSFISFYTAGTNFNNFSSYVFVNGGELSPSTNIMISQNTSGSGEMKTFGADSGTLVYSSSVAYSALALLQKAIINSSIYEKQEGIYIADINNSKLPFYIDDKFIDELSATSIIENFYNQKNLWEIMIEAGHYIHAIPELKFGSDDRFMITFNRLGRTDQKEDNSTKVSIFNSQNVEDYICATSSYVTNMVQLGGYIEEWVFPKTTNEQLLVSNDTAEIIVSKPIIELLEVTVVSNIDQTIGLVDQMPTVGTINLKKGQSADLTKYLYEENVYKTLSLDYNVIPNRGIAMYYSLGKNVITGGQFQLPQKLTNIYSDYAFKKIIYSAFDKYLAKDPKPDKGYWTDLLVSNFSFLVKYRTKDSVRQNHIRPDLRKYLLNSKYDRFPEHNQFNNQTDVVVDSIKFGNNVYGKLIKTGNSTYDIYEWNDNYDNVKHKGELYRINGELYYVAKVTHYYYSSYILSKITYSKDYNQLSAIIGIPSEPRFYEISEQSLIWREFAINDILLLTDNKEQLQYNSNYVFNYKHLKNLILGQGTDFAKYAVTVYKGDKDIDKYSQTVGEADFYKEVLNPINAYSSENTLTYEWDMIDNYSAGDKVIDVDVNMSISSPDERAYDSLRAVPYTDIYGKSALLDFYILGKIDNLSTEEIKALPESPIKTKQDAEDARTFIGDYDILATNVYGYDTNFNGRGIGLLKDCREAMSINYNLQLATNSDTFVISPYFYTPNKKNICVVLLSTEVNKLSNGYIDDDSIITPIDINGETMYKYFTFEATQETMTSAWNSEKTVVTNFGIDLSSIFGNVANEHFVDTQGYQRIKSIAILLNAKLETAEEGEAGGELILPYKTQFIFARNIPDDWSKEKALSPIYFGSPNKNTIFKNKQ